MFTAPPNYDAPNPKWSDFVGYAVVVDPVRKMLQIQTKYGNQDCWECIIWVNENGTELVPYTGVRIFSQRLLDVLDVAAKTNSPLVGQVTREGNAVRVIPLDEVGMAEMSRLWDVVVKNKESAA